MAVVETGPSSAQLHSVKRDNMEFGVSYSKNVPKRFGWALRLLWRDCCCCFKAIMTCSGMKLFWWVCYLRCLEAKKHGERRLTPVLAGGWGGSSEEHEGKTVWSQLRKKLWSFWNGVACTYRGPSLAQDPTFIGQTWLSWQLKALTLFRYECIEFWSYAFHIARWGDPKKWKGRSSSSLLNVLDKRGGIRKSFSSTDVAAPQSSNGQLTTYLSWDFP